MTVVVRFSILVSRHGGRLVNMADHNTVTGTQVLKNSKIVVNVEEALQDVLVVTYALENKLFQGVLLDSSKR